MAKVLYQAQGTKPAPMEKYRILYKQMDNQRLAKLQEPMLPIDIRAIENRSLETDQNYNFLKNRLKQFNKRLQLAQQQQQALIQQGVAQDNAESPFDSYELQSINSLYTILSDINGIDDRQLQATQLQAARAWFEEREGLITQRTQQGIIRYKTLGRHRSLHSSAEKMPQAGAQTQRASKLLPYQDIQATMEPYEKNWRTLHKDYEMPGKHLDDYKRKILNIQPLVEATPEAKLPRVTYPRPVKVIEEDPTKDEDKGDEQNKPQDGAVIAVAGVDGATPPPAEEVDEGNNEPMLGEEPQEPEQEQPEEVEDKLGPKVKLYIDPIRPPITTRDPKDVENKAMYKFAVGDQNAAQRALELRFQKVQHQELQKAKEDSEMVQLGDRWSKGKSKFTKELQKRLELIANRPSYSFIAEEKPAVFNLPEQEQKKYHLTNPLFGAKRSSAQSVDLSLVLPQITTDRPRLSGYQSSVQKAKLKDLKKRFRNVLHLRADVQEREVPKSLCQYTSRFKSFSAVLQEHSQEKQRLIQMEQVMSIKERLTKNRVGVNAVNIQTIAKGLCLPPEQEKLDVGFPDKSLPSNPFMIQKKKKKKKK